MPVVQSDKNHGMTKREVKKEVRVKEARQEWKVKKMYIMLDSQEYELSCSSWNSPVNPNKEQNEINNNHHQFSQKMKSQQYEVIIYLIPTTTSSRYQFSMLPI